MYQSNVITALSDIPPLVETFAATVGWTVGGSSSAPTLTHPTLVGAQAVTLTYQSAATYQYLRLDAGSSRYAMAQSPYRGTTATPTIIAPTKVHLLGGLTPEPYIAIVVEYGFNLYRHLYFGYAEILGSYTGGEIIAGSCYGRRASGTGFYYDSDIAYPFTAWHNQDSNLTQGHENGWMRIAHASNPNTWRKFKRNPTAASGTYPADTCVMGGFRDEINDPLLARGLSPYAGVSILTSVNLYAPDSGGFFTPVGRPAGVRLLHMRDTDPGAQVNDGVYNWRAFPAFKKSVATSYARTTTSWPTDETSYLVGYAYLEG